MPKKRLLLHYVLKGIRPKYVSNVWMNSEGARNDWALFIYLHIQFVTPYVFFGENHTFDIVPQAQNIKRYNLYATK